MQTEKELIAKSGSFHSEILATSLTKYIKEKKTQEECIGFIHGFEECMKIMAQWKYSELYQSWYTLIENRIITSWTKEFNDETVDVCEYAFDEDEEVEFVTEMQKIFGSSIIEAYPIYNFKTQKK